MIRIDRPPTPPDFKTAELLERGRQASLRFLSESQRQSRFEFSPKYYGKAKELLREIQHNKCAFCESTVGVTGTGSIENFRPKSKYPELAYNWDNLLVACPICSANKRAQFPTDERDFPLLVDPASEDPSRAIAFDESGVAHPRNRRGEITIEVFALNRQELVKARKRAIEHFLRFGEGRPSDGEPYAGAVRSILGQSKRRAGAKDYRPAPFRDGAGRARPVVVKLSAGPIKAPFSYVSSIHIRNFRAIKELKLNFLFSNEEPGWRVLLGENAAGKSTVLKAIAMALMGPQHLSSVQDYQKGILRRYKDGDLIREAASGSVTVEYVNGDSTVMKISRTGVRFAVDQNGMDGTIRGYGSMRLLPEDGEDPAVGSASGDVSNLFHPRRNLVNAGKLLIGFNASDPDKFDRFATHIKYLLRLDEPLEVVNGELFVPINGTPVRIAELSDGYQAMIALAVDLMNGFPDSHSMESASGILLLDELGTHLHPRWRLEFVTRLRATFQGLQVIATTHEPLCLRGLKKGEVGLLRRDPAGLVEFVNDDQLPNIEAMRVDQILTSPAFGLNSTIDPAIESDFVRYYALLAQLELSTEDQQQMQELATKLKPHRHLAYTRRDQMMYDVIDKFLAKEAKHPEKQKLKEVTMRKLWEIWSEMGIPGVGGGES